MNNENFKKLLREFIESRGENLFDEGSKKPSKRRGVKKKKKSDTRPTWQRKGGHGQKKLGTDDQTMVSAKDRKRRSRPRTPESKLKSWEKKQAEARGMTLSDFQAEKEAKAIRQKKKSTAAASQAAGAAAKAARYKSQWGKIKGCCGGEDTKIYNLRIFDSFHARSSAIARGIHKNEVLEMVKKVAFGEDGFLNQYLNGNLIVGSGNDAKFGIKAKINRVDPKWNIWLVARYYPNPVNGSVGIVTVFNEAHKGEIFSGAGMKQQFDAGNVTATIAKIPSLLPWGSVEDRPTHDQGGDEVEMPEDIYLRGYPAAAE